MSEKLNCNGLKPCPFCGGEQILPELWEEAMTKERLMQLEDLLIWMSGGVVFSSDQADLFSEGLAFISAETVRQGVQFTQEEMEEK